MKTMMPKITYLCLSILFVLFLFGCVHSSAPEEFTFRYSLENTRQFKVEFQLDPDSTWRIGHHKYFFDQFEGKLNPLQIEGKLPKEEWERFVKLIDECKLEKMDDSYGFDHGGEVDNSIVYMVELKQNGKSKFVTVNATTEVELPDDFNRLVAFTGKFISDQMRASE